ncbi:hypothetical protein [Streptomyces syringium]
MTADTGTTSRLEADAEPERMLDHLEARMEAQQFSTRAHRT